MEKLEYVKRLREYLRDYEELNRLMEFKEESKDINLELCLEMALGEANALVPATDDYLFESHPMPNLIVLGAIPHVLISCTILRARNELTYNNGGITVKIPDSSVYLNVLSMLERMYHTAKESYVNNEKSKNIAKGFGGSSSPYAYL